MSVRRNPRYAASQEGGYAESITDMMIGLLFLFLIMLMYFASQLRQSTEEVVSSERTRSMLLSELQTYLRSQDVDASVDFSTGVLHLPSESLFEKGADTPKPRGVDILRKVADGLDTLLPCYSSHRSAPRPERCGPETHRLDAVFIEGHTDSDPLSGNARLKDNWDLSAARASSSYRILTGYKAGLKDYLSDDPASGKARSLFSVAGFADERPLVAGSDEAAKEKNRRIDIRFVMDLPDSETLFGDSEEASPAPSPAPTSPASPAPAAPVNPAEPG